MGVHAVRNLGVRLPVRLGKARKRGTRQAGSNPASCTIYLLTFRGGICYNRGEAVHPKRGVRRFLLPNCRRAHQRNQPKPAGRSRTGPPFARPHRHLLSSRRPPCSLARRPLRGADRHAVVIKHGTAPGSSTMRTARLPGVNP